MEDTVEINGYTYPRSKFLWTLGRATKFAVCQCNESIIESKLGRGCVAPINVGDMVLICESTPGYISEFLELYQRMPEGAGELEEAITAGHTWHFCEKCLPAAIEYILEIPDYKEFARIIDRLPRP